MVTPRARSSRVIAASLAAGLGASLAAADPPPASPPSPPPATAPRPAAAAPSPAMVPPGAAPPSCTGAPGDHSRSGMLELGGSFGLLIASGVRDVALAASIGRFVADNVELSAVASVSSVEAADRSATVWSALVEPSYHLPLGPTSAAVLGMGTGVGYERTLGAGLAVAPRIGVSVIVGKTSVLTTALSYEYITHSAREGRTDAALIALTSTLRVSFGYAVRW